MNEQQLSTIAGLARRLRGASERLGYSWEDLAQDVAVHAWQHEHERTTEHVNGWLSAIAKQKAIQRWRREQARNKETHQPHAIQIDATTPCHMAQARETLQQAMGAVLQLHPKHAQALAYRLQGIEDTKAARALRLSTYALRKIVSRARHHIEKEIQCAN